MDIEIWKPVPGYEGYYEASSYGNIRSLDRYIKTRLGHYQLFHGKQLSFTVGNHGYYEVMLCDGTSQVSYLVHRVIGYTFLGEPSIKCTDINHIDGDKLNNHIDNLEWCTRSQNIKHAFNIGLREITENQKQLARKRLGNPVYCVDTDTVYISKTEAAEKLGISTDQVLASVRRHGKLSERGSSLSLRYRIVDISEKDDYEYVKHDQSLLFKERRYARVAGTTKIYHSILEFCQNNDVLEQSVRRNIELYAGYIIDEDICLIDCGYEDNITEIDVDFDNDIIYKGKRLVLKNMHKTTLKCSNGHVYLSPFCCSKYFPQVNNTYFNDCMREHNGEAKKLGLRFWYADPDDLTNDEVDMIWQDHLEIVELKKITNQKRRVSQI